VVQQHARLGKMPSVVDDQYLVPLVSRQNGLCISCRALMPTDLHGRAPTPCLGNVRSRNRLLSATAAILSPAHRSRSPKTQSTGQTREPGQAQAQQSMANSRNR